jgi:release factor H-coupled RctB family protein
MHKSRIIFGRVFIFSEQVVETFFLFTFLSYQIDIVKHDSRAHFRIHTSRDGCHNSITRRASDGGVEWLHRKGAVEAEGDFVVIPGSRGSMTYYVVKPIGDGKSHACSLAHGAGLKWARSDARQRMRERFSVSELAQTPLGGRVVCEERDLFYEEAPAAYKNIEAVIDDLVAAGLVSVIATLRPFLTYKTRKVRR